MAVGAELASPPSPPMSSIINSAAVSIRAETAVSGRLAARDLIGILGQENPVAAIRFGRGAGDQIVVADEMDSGADVARHCAFDDEVATAAHIDPVSTVLLDRAGEHKIAAILHVHPYATVA